MQPSELTLGFVPIARPTFDLPLAAYVTNQVRARLLEAGFRLTGPDTLVSTLDEAQHTAQTMVADPPDLLLVFQATFADSTMVMSLAEMVDAPLVMWAIPEARTGERLRLNSLCGINLAGHSLRRAGHRYDTIYAPPDDPAALENVRTIAAAGHIRHRLRRTRIGRVGEHPAGFDTCRPNIDGLKQRFGVEMVQIELTTIFDGARAADPNAIDALEQDVHTWLAGLDQVDQMALRHTLETYVTLRQLADQQNLDGFAVRCWPEFFTDLGGAACGALSMMNDSLIPCSCETDVNGAITQLILQWLSGEAAFDTDMVSFEMDENTAVFWHCGKAPLSMADPAFTPRATIHTNRQLPLLMGFSLKPGRITFARLSEATGGFRLVVGGGEMIQVPMSYTGTSGVIRFDRPAAEVLNMILSEGLEHHVALTYGNHIPALLALAKMLDLPVLHL
jgi:L-fucose isomerase-like protein